MKFTGPHPSPSRGEFWNSWLQSWKTLNRAELGRFLSPSCCTQYLGKTKKIVFARLTCWSHKIPSIMQHSGMLAKTQKGLTASHTGTAAHRTFQIKTFSTELKNHVMVMDFVKSNWFPSQRRAKVCIIHMCQGLKTAEQPASRYEVRPSWVGRCCAPFVLGEMECCVSHGQPGCLSGLKN